MVKLHIKRLLGGQETAERGELMRRVEEHIRERLPESGFGRAAFERADKITRLCDRLALEFSFEAPAEGAVEVFAAPGQDRETRIRYRVEGGKIWLEPWPFAADASGGVILAYRREGYPQTLTPVIVPFALSRQAF